VCKTGHFYFAKNRTFSLCLDIKKNISVIDLELFLSNDSPNEFAERMVKAQDKLFDDISS